MKKIIKELDKEKGIIRIQVADERWYFKGDNPDPYDSVTWISSFYPKGIGFWKFLANTGWDEAEAIKSTAGGKGSKVHQVCNDLMDGKEVHMESKYLNPNTEQLEELTLDEYQGAMSFVDWYREAKPKILGREMVVFNEQEGYAGTLDILAEFDNALWIIDIKPSQDIWPSHEIQVAAYLHALLDTSEILDFLQKKYVKASEFPFKLAILQVGYRRNKRGWKFTEIEDKYDLFLAAKRIHANETAGQKPLKKDYPVSLRLSTEKGSYPQKTSN